MSKLLVVLLLLAVGGYVLYNKSAAPKTDTTQKTQAEMSQNNTGVATTPSNVMIEIKDFKFSPNRTVVKAGEVVSVTNMDIAGHTVTSDQAGLFDSGIVSKGATKTFVAPSTPGEYPYHCTPHPSMTGVLVVE